MLNIMTGTWKIPGYCTRLMRKGCNQSSVSPIEYANSCVMFHLVWLYCSLIDRFTYVRHGYFTGFLAATKQLYEWFSPSVCLSDCLWRLFHYVPIIMKCSGVITNDKSNVHAKGQGQRSKAKVTGVKTQFRRFRTVTPVWIDIWWWNDAQTLMLLRRGALLFFEVIH